MNTGGFNSHVVALEDAVRSLERSLEDSRSQWDDQTRNSFDRTHADPIVRSAQQTANQLSELAKSLNAVIRALGYLE